MAKGQMRSNKEAKKPKKDKPKEGAASTFSATMEKAGAGKGGKK